MMESGTLPREQAVKRLRSDYPNESALSLYYMWKSIREKGTCMWIFKQAAFVQWKIPSRSSSLWIHGPPFCGKSTLSTAIIDYLRDENTSGSDDYGFAWFSFATSERQSINQFLASLILQLWQSLPNSSPLFDIHSGHLDSIFGRDGNPMPEPRLQRNQLCQILVMTISQLSDAYVVIDAIDEISLDERTQLLETITIVYQKVSNLHLLVISRRYSYIEDALKWLPTAAISIPMPAVKDDIRTYVKARLQKIAKGWTKELVSEVLQDTVEKSNSVFGFASFLVSELETARSPIKVHQVLGTAQRRLTDIYERILSEIPKMQRDIAVTWLRWLIVSTEPLNWTQLTEATALDPKATPAFDKGRCLFEIGPTILSIFKGWVVADVNGDLGFAHSSLREYLMSAEIEGGFASDFAIDYRASEQFIAECCLEYITFYSTSPKRRQSLDDFVAFPLLEYASKYWIVHAQKWASRGPDVDGRENSSLPQRVENFIHSTEAFHAWQQVYDPEDPDKTPFSQPQSVSSPMHYAVSSGILEVVKGLVKQGHEVSVKNKYGRQPLHTATTYGLTTIAEELVRNGASPTARDSSDKMPLVEAAVSEKGDLVDIYLQKTSPNLLCKIETGSTIFHYLAMYASADIFQRFLEASRSCRERHREYHAPYSKSRVHITRHIHLQDSADCTLLHRAVQEGNDSIVALLIREGADVNLQDAAGDTPLHFAMQFERQTSRELLINGRASVRAKNKAMRTPIEVGWQQKSLDWASYEVDAAATNTIHRRGTQADCAVMKKISTCTGPERIFRKTYDLSQLQNADYQVISHGIERENHILQRLEHPFIVSYLGYEDRQTPSEDEIVLYLEYCEGGDLDKNHIKPDPEPAANLTDSAEGEARRAPIRPQQAETIEPLGESDLWLLCYQLFSALSYLHYGVWISEKGECRFEKDWDTVIHRDIKPANVVLTYKPDHSRIAKLCDLGISREFSQNQTMPSTRGSREYLPPEVREARPEQDNNDALWQPKGDVWSLGKTLDRLHKKTDVSPDGELAKLLKSCQEEKLTLRPTSLTVLERVLELSTSLLPPKPAAIGAGYLALAFHKVAEELDVRSTFYSTDTKSHRERTLLRLERLLDDGAMGSSCEEGRSLHLVVLLGNCELLRKLLSSGHSPNEQWLNSGWTPLHLAAQEGNGQAVQLLLDSGSSNVIEDTHGYLPEHYARSHQDVRKIFYESGNSSTNVVFHGNNYGVQIGYIHQSISGGVINFNFGR